MIKRGLLFIFFLFLIFARPAAAAEPVKAYLFYGEGCPHCAKESQFLDQLETKYPNFIVTEFEVYYHQDNSLLLQKVGKTLNASTGGVPFLVIGDKSFIGFGEGISEREIENRVIECSRTVCRDVVSSLLGQAVASPQAVSPLPSEEPKLINLPFVGQKDVSKFSLPLLTLILAALDGFNPCAMWTLLFLIGLLLGMKNKTRMWLLGIAFIMASALVYFLFLAAWLNLFLFLGLVVWVRVVIGLVALASGGYYLRDYWVNRNGACSVTGGAKRQRVFARLKEITQNQNFLLALFGIILLAFAVNLVELVCSAGLPAVYTQILSLADLPRWQHYLYLLGYILIFMLDDLLIFFTAMVTLRVVGVQGQYSRASRLIGGLLMLVIGLLLVFKPEWLMFG